MRKTAFKLCGFTLVMGIFSAFIRWLQRINGFEPETGLAITGSPYGYAVAGFILLFAILLLVLVRRLSGLCFDERFPQIYAKGIPFVMIPAGLVGAVTALGGILTLLRAVSTSKTIFDLVLGVFALLCAAGMASLILASAKPGKRKNGVFGAVSTVFFLCYWLIAAYKYSAADPVLWHFAPRLLSICALVLACYYHAGFVFKKPKPLSALYFSGLSVFLCITVLADAYPTGEQLITLGFAVLLSLLSFAQLSSAEQSKH